MSAWIVEYEFYYNIVGVAGSFEEDEKVFKTRAKARRWARRHKAAFQRNYAEKIRRVNIVKIAK